MASTLFSASDCCSPCAHSPTVTIITQTGGGGPQDANFLMFDTIALLKAQPSIDTNEYAAVLGGAAKGDGYGGTYYWVASDEADDGLTTIRPDDYVGSLWKKHI